MSQLGELEMIARDGCCLRELVLSLKTAKGGGILGLLLLPTLAFYAVEVSDWLERTGRATSGKLLRDYNSSFRGVRARLKVFEDRKLGLEGLQALMDRCAEQSLKHFNANHSGLLGPLKRWLQPDLGLYFVGRDLVLTTDLAAATLSLMPDFSDRSVFDREGGSPPAFSVKLGEFVGAVTSALPSDARYTVHSTLAGKPPGALRRQDEKSERVYSEIQAKLGLPTRFASAITALVCQVNFVHRWARFVISPTELLHFRLRYLTAVHSLAGLKQVNALVRGDTTIELARVASEVLGSRSARQLRNLPPRLRNALAHYNLGQDFKAVPSEASLPERLVQHYSSAVFSEVSGAVDDVLEAVSAAFLDLVPLRARAVPLDD